MSYDAVAALRAGGHPVDVISGSQREILAGLSEEEVTTLNSVKARIEAASGEVTGQANDNGIIVF